MLDAFVNVGSCQFVLHVVDFNVGAGTQVAEAITEQKAKRIKRLGFMGDRGIPK